MKKNLIFWLLLMFCATAGLVAQPSASSPDSTAGTSLLSPTDTLKADTVTTANADTVIQAPETEGGEIEKMLKKINGIPDASDSGTEEKKSIPSILEVISFQKVFWAILFLVAGWLIIRFITRILEAFAERNTGYRITIRGFIPVLKILGWILLIFIVVAGIFQPPLSTLVAFSASAGIAIGFASQDILKNIFGGIMILFDRPFKAGDKIEVNNYYGEVLEVGLRSTRIVTPDDNLVSIPNSEIMNSPVSNANAGEANCQVAAEIYLPVAIDTRRVREIATQAAQVSKYVYLQKPISVLFFNVFTEKESIYKMKVKAYVHDIRDEFAFKSELTETIIARLLEDGIIHVGGPA